MTFIPRTKVTIKKIYTDNVKSLTTVSDFVAGSTIDTLADTHADGQFEQQVHIKNILDLDSLDNKHGDDLDTEGRAFSIVRKPEAKSSSLIEVIDSGITKNHSQVASGGASIGDTALNAVNVIGVFPATGFILIGERTEPEFEQLGYTDFSGGVFTLSAPITKDHGLSEPIVLKTVGNRTFTLGQTVYALDDSGEKINFNISSDYIIYDGEDRAYDVPVLADVAGTDSNVPANSVENFEGNAPFEGALVINPTIIDNGIDKEADASYRDTIRNAPFILSRGVRAAIITEVLNAEFEGRRVLYVQPFESLDSSEPSELFIDDGGGFVPTEFIVEEEILTESSVGGEYLFFLDNQPRLKKGALAGGKTIALYKNGNVLLVQGTHFKLNFHDGTIKLLAGQELQTGESLQVGSVLLSKNGYVKYTGLLQEAQWKVDGKKDDPANYRGVKSFGGQITLRVPTTQDISVELTIFTSKGTAKSFAKTEIIQNLLEYIASITIGGIVLLDQLRLAVLKVDGVIKVNFTAPAADIQLPIGIRARVQAQNIIII